ADTAKLVREIDHPNVKMMYDTFHANIEEKNIAEALDACKDVMVHVHISENDRSTPGKGGANWKENWANLKRIGYKDLLLIEAFGQGVPALAGACASACPRWRPRPRSGARCSPTRRRSPRTAWRS